MRKSQKRKTVRRQRTNEMIRVPQVRVIGADNEQLGVMDTAQAIDMAKQNGHDLIEVSPMADPPVCRISDYGAYLYNQEKKERKQKARQKKVGLKGIRLSLKIGPHDLENRKKQTMKFLEKGDKAKVEMILRGRERAYADRGMDIMKQFAQSISEEQNVIVEKDVSRQGNRLFMIIGKK